MFDRGCRQSQPSVAINAIGRDATFRKKAYMLRKLDKGRTLFFPKHKFKLTEKNGMFINKKNHRPVSVKKLF